MKKISQGPVFSICGDLSAEFERLFFQTIWIKVGVTCNDQAYGKV